MAIGLRTAATIVLEAESSSIMAFEDFVEGLAFLSAREKARLLVAGGEMLDNIVKHGSPLGDARVAARARRRPGPEPAFSLSFFFKAEGFAAFARGCEDSAAAERKPLFDPAHRRWRGFGLVMCRNLARRVAFRPGKIVDRIFLEFGPEA